MKLVLGLVLAAFIVAAAGITSWSLLAPEAKAPPLPFGLMLSAVVAIYLYSVFSLPHRITLASDGTVKFISILRRRTLRADEIKSIKPEGGQFGCFMVRTERRKIRILAQFDGFHDFLTRLQALHPGVDCGVARLLGTTNRSWHL